MKTKRYQAKAELIDKEKHYTVEEATELVKQIASAKFDETVELVMHLNLDTKKSDQQLRGAMVLPHGTGKTKKVLVLAKGEAAQAAQNAGADYVGAEEMLEKIEKEAWFDYDVIIATPDMMPALGKIGKVLGPKGLMPNPKTGTVTENPAKTVDEIKKGRVEYRNDKYGNIHVQVGKASFTVKQLSENIKYFGENIMKQRPTSIKGRFLKSVTLTTTMGPSIKVFANSFDK